MNDLSGVWERRDELQIVDVREQWEWNAGRIEGAVHIPLNDLLSGGDKGMLDQGTPVVLVCKTGSRSELATLMLQARGYQAENLEGGMEAWAAAGLPYGAPDGSPGRVA